jgi:hypothetical protein
MDLEIKNMIALQALQALQALHVQNCACACQFQPEDAVSTIHQKVGNL